jgi:23S rRNA pseudouridine2457 synthase
LKYLDCQEPAEMDSYRSLAFYKPCGVVSSFTAASGLETLKAYIPVPGVYVAGRLDADSEGLLILTNDPRLARRLTHPLHPVPKTYLVQVEGKITPQAIAKIQTGVVLASKRTRRCQVLAIPEPKLPERRKPVTPHSETTWLRIVLREGKKHQIRHLTAAVGFPTIRLVRVAIGSITLGDLQPGEWRDLSSNEVAGLLGKPAREPRFK